MPTRCERLSSGMVGVDKVLDGLITGDNVVWTGSDGGFHQMVQRPYLDAGDGPSLYVTTKDAPSVAAARLGSGVVVLDARPGARCADPLVLEAAVLERATPDARIIVDGFDAVVRRWGADRALAFFSRLCPQLFDVGALCYWHMGPGSRPILDGVRSITQCVVEVSPGQLRVVKAEGRHDVQGNVFRVRVSDGELHVEFERALGRLAEGLRRVRAARGLSQTDLARAAGVSPSAISQAEASRRGLGLDTVVAISHALGIGLDDLLGVAADPGYVVARRDRAPVRNGSTPLLDDPAAGLRAFLIRLPPGERGLPPAGHKGPELVVVASGLVQIDLGGEMPVVRAGDAVLATNASVRAWRNLLPQPALLFWIPRDPMLRSA